MIKVLGHEFVSFGDDEMRCKNCDFIIWKSNTPKEAIKAVKSLSEESFGPDKIFNCPDGFWAQASPKYSTKKELK